MTRSTEFISSSNLADEPAIRGIVECWWYHSLGLEIPLVSLDILTFSAIDLWEVKGGGDKLKIQDGFAGPGTSSIAESF